MKQKGPLYTHAVRGNAADGECLVNTGASNADYHTLHHLHALTIALYDANVNLHRVTGVDLRAAIDSVLAGDRPSESQTPSLGCNIKWKEGNEPQYFNPQGSA